MSDSAELSHQTVVPRRRNPMGRPFPKGVSGNPGGRPRQDVTELARAHTVECVKALVEALKSPRERVPAATALLDRGWGKPQQRIEVGADAEAIGLHLTAARALVAAWEAGQAEAAPPQIEARAEPPANALDAPKPTE